MYLLVIFRFKWPNGIRWIRSLLSWFALSFPAKPSFHNSCSPGLFRPAATVCKIPFAVGAKGISKWLWKPLKRTPSLLVGLYSLSTMGVWNSKWNWGEMNTYFAFSKKYILLFPLWYFIICLFPQNSFNKKVLRIPWDYSLWINFHVHSISPFGLKWSHLKHLLITTSCWFVHTHQCTHRHRWYTCVHMHMQSHAHIHTVSRALCICKHSEGTMCCRNCPAEFVIQCKLLSADK